VAGPGRDGGHPLFAGAEPTEAQTILQVGPAFQIPPSK
jgi:hypothetical protein